MREQYNQSAISPINASMRTDAQYGMNNIYDPSQIAKQMSLKDMFQIVITGARAILPKAALIL